MVEKIISVIGILIGIILLCSNMFQTTLIGSLFISLGIIGLSISIYSYKKNKETKTKT